MKINEINRSAAVGWCPIKGNTEMMVTGSIAGSLEPDFSSGAKMDFFNLNLNGNKATYKGSLKSYDRFNRITWGNPNEKKYPLGVVCGAMVDGTIGIWNPEKMSMEKNGGDDGGLIKCLDKHQGSVKGISFNPIQKNLLASAGDDSKLLIWNLQKPSEPTPFAIGGKNPHHGQVISNIAWNRVYEYILATTSHSGVSVIWDLKQKKPIVPFRNPNSRVARRYSSIAWNPTLATQLCIASEDDNAPVIELWDLRSAYRPITELRGEFGHTKGILSVSWNPEDSNLMLSSGKDNRVLVWNPSKGEFLGEVAQSNNWIYDVQWSYKTSILSYGSYDGTISINTLQDTNPSGKKIVKNSHTAPKWLQRPIGGFFGFGGRFVSFDNTKIVKLSSISTDSTFVKKAKAFENVIKAGGFETFCEFKITTKEQDTWSVIRILFEKNEKVKKDKLLQFLGFDKEKITSSVQKEISGGFKKEGSEVVVKEEKPSFDNDKVDELIKKSLMVSDLESAVECCLLSGRMDDALVLSACGGPKLWGETREKYFKIKKAPILKILSFICNGKFESIVAESDLENWKETLAILCTYSKEKFSSLCSLLGERLENEKKDLKSATLCYMCSGKFDRVIKTWLIEFENNDETLQSFMEKVLIFQQASKKIDNVSEELTKKYIEYATKLSSEGLLSISLRYLNIVSKLKVDSPDLNLLRFRVYHSLNKPFGEKPRMPFGIKEKEQEQQVIKKQQPIQPVFKNTENPFATISKPSEFAEIISKNDSFNHELTNENNSYLKSTKNNKKVEEKEEVEDKGYQPWSRPEDISMDGLEESLGLKDKNIDQIINNSKEETPILSKKYNKIYESLSSSFDLLTTANISSTHLKLIGNGLEKLYEYLNTSVNPLLAGLLFSFVKNIEEKKFGQAEKIIKTISSNHWKASKPFLKPLKFLNKNLKKL